jgi:hypothetical protein
MQSPSALAQWAAERVRALVIIWIGTYCARKRNDPMYCAHEILPFPHWRKA